MRAEIADFLKELVLAAGQAVRGAGAAGGVAEKEGRGNFVTDADRASEEVILARIARTFPGDAVLSEESRPGGADPLAAPRLWVIDPLDGTNNFRFGRGYAAVSVAYVERGVTLAGAAYDPFRGELFFAERGGGAFRNGAPVRVGARADLAGASAATDNCYDPAGTRRNVELFLRLEPTPWLLVRGSAVLGLCEVACGRTDLYFHTALQPWDNAAAFLLVREAGGQVATLDGRPADLTTREAVAGNAGLVGECLRRFAAA